MVAILFVVLMATTMSHTTTLLMPADAKLHSAPAPMELPASAQLYSVVAPLEFPRFWSGAAVAPLRLIFWKRSGYDSNPLIAGHSLVVAS